MVQRKAKSMLQMFGCLCLALSFIVSGCHRNAKTKDESTGDSTTSGKSKKSRKSKNDSAESTSSKQTETQDKSAVKPADSGKSDKTKDDSAKAANSNQGETLESEFVIGKTTKDEVIAKLGKPSGVGKSGTGEETLTYNRSHITGKAFIPWYFGRDSYRRVLRVYTFSKDGILIKFNTEEEHY